MSSHWDSYAGWDLITPPLRPAPSVVQRFKELLGGLPYVALLGCIQELADVAEDVTAVDSSSEVVKVWPGMAYHETWERLGSLLGSRSAVLGDGP